MDTASDSSGNPRPGAFRALVVVTALGVGFAAGWFARSGTAPSGLLVQEGRFSLFDGEKEVYYPRPFATPPHLEFPNVGVPEVITAVEQRADGFKVRTKPGSSVQNQPWRAEGVTAK
jgi:hypothetical protein